MANLRFEDHSDRKQDYGPCWADVYDLWGWIEKELDITLELHAELTRSINNKLGLRCAFVSRETGVVLGVVGLGPAFTSAPKTMPAGLVRALYDVQRSADERLSKGLPPDHPSLPGVIVERIFFRDG